MLRETVHLTRPTETYIKWEYNKLAYQIKDTNKKILDIINYPSKDRDDTIIIKKLFSPFSQANNEIYTFLKDQEKRRINLKTDEQFYWQKISHINEESIKKIYRIVFKRLKTKNEIDKHLLYDIKWFLKQIFDLEKNGYYSKWNNLYISEDDYFLYKELLILHTDQEYLEFGNFSEYIKDYIESDALQQLHTILEDKNFIHIKRETLKEIKGIILEYIDRVYYHKTKAKYWEIKIKRSLVLQDIENIKKQIIKDFNTVSIILQN